MLHVHIKYNDASLFIDTILWGARFSSLHEGHRVEPKLRQHTHYITKVIPHPRDRDRAYHILIEHFGHIAYGSKWVHPT